jgi:cell division transport system permease protein
LRIFLYSLQTALKSIWHEKWINLLTVLSISIGLLILSSFIVITLNMDSVLQRWSKSFGLVAYLDEDLTKEAETTLEELLRQDEDILEIRYISKDRAAQEIQAILGDDARILEDFRENPLPSSFELRLKTELLDPELVRKKAEAIQEMSGIEEVQYGEKWLSSLSTIAQMMKMGTVFLGCAIFTAIIFITYSTIKIFFYRRKDEIETLKLLGATKSFIRLPFLLEGLFIGTTGGLISAFALFGLYSVVLVKIPELLPSVTILILSLPLEAYISVPLAGALMSFTGSFFAVGKIRY